MNENDLMRLEAELVAAVEALDRATAETLCARLAVYINQSPAVIPLRRSKDILYRLRRKRMFGLILDLAEAFLNSGQDQPQIRLQYCQALVDQGRKSAAESIINELLTIQTLSKAEKLEAFGLQGRIQKQRFVAVAGKRNERTEDCIRLALEAYLAGYETENTSYWHAINAVALLKRAEKEGIALDRMPDPETLAGVVEECLDRLGTESVGPQPPWEIATLLEVQIAGKKYGEALETALAYASCRDADAFEIGSTLRQLEEIWELNDDEPPGVDLLPVLRSALLEREGGALVLNRETVASEKMCLEAKFGDDAPKTIKWYKEGLERTGSVARIELADGRGIGTAGVFDAKDFFSDIEGLVLLTNSHVVSENPHDRGLPPEKVKANLQGIGEVFEIDRVVWSSPEGELDASILKLKKEPDVPALPISSGSMQMAEPAPRIYIIGHPSGRDLEISLNDNRMVGSNETFLHYRTPTEPGSSGSPVFDQYGWEVVALHHGGGESLPRIDDTPGTYQANEGITISAIRNAVLLSCSQAA